MATRQFLAVDRIPLVGGALAVDLVNTTGARASATPRERLHTYADLLVWSERTALVTSARRRQLEAEARRRPAVAKRAHDGVLEFREALYRLFLGIIEHRAPPAADLAALNRLVAERDRRRHLTIHASGAAWTWDLDPRELDQMLWPIVDSAVDVLISDRLPSLKKCGECDWIFIDASKNQRRVWCKAACRDRVKARRAYRRRR